MQLENERDRTKAFIEEFTINVYTDYQITKIAKETFIHA